MKRNRHDWAVFSVNRRKPKIDPKPAYQRGPVWSVSDQQLFIDSILRDFDIPKLYLRKIDGAQYQWEVIDGQQRLRAIWGFLSDEYPVPDDSDPIGAHSIAGKFYSDLPEDLVDHLDAYELSIVTVEEAEDQEVEDMFLRLQNGTPLNSAEKRNAISGSIRDFIQDTANESKLMNISVPFRNTRYSYDEVAAQMLAIEMHGGPTNVRAAQLKSLYQDNKTFNKNSQVAKKLKRVMNFLNRAYPQKSPELTKVNLLSLYTVASEALGKYDLSDRAIEFGKWFVGFENRRRQEEDKPEDERDERMVSYQLAVLQQTANISSQRERQSILTEDMVLTIAELRLLDNRRQFTYEQRAAIFRKSNGQCVNPDDNKDCEKKCVWDNFHADHITAYKKGGRTTVSNGQLLCASCNLQKSDS